MNKLKHFLALLLIGSVIIAGAGTLSAGEVEGSEQAEVQGVTMHCTMSSFGKEVETIEIHVKDALSFADLTGEDYLITGCKKTANDNRTMEMEARKVSYTPDAIILETDPFMLYQSAETFTITSADERISVNYEDVDLVLCPEQDAFTDETITIGEDVLQYHLFTPELEEGVLYPVIVYNHGGGCTGYDGVLNDDSFAVAWAVPESQSGMPCYVIAPYRAQGLREEDVMAGVKAAMDLLVQEGQADPERLYMSGESMGSIFTMTFVNAYPDYLAAIAVMNGGPLDIEKDATLETTLEMNLNSPWSDEELKALADSKTSVMFIQGLGDISSVPIRYATAYKKLEAFGMTPDVDLVWNAYTADQFNFLLKGNTKVQILNRKNIAVDPITGVETYTNGNFHNSSRAAGWDSRVKMWLMEQYLNGKVLGE